MAMNLNQVTIAGTVTRDPELRDAGQTKVTRVGVAINERVKTNGQWQEMATYVDVTVWGRDAETACTYLKKGSQVLFEARLKLAEWTKNGQKQQRLELVSNRMHLGSKPKQESSRDSDNSSPFDDDDEPF